MKHKEFNKVLPYTYYIVRKSDNMKYYGVRYYNIKLGKTPKEDFANIYFSSGCFSEDFKENPTNYCFRIANTFDSVAEASEYEERLLRRVYTRSDWANNSVSKVIFYTEEIRDKMVQKGLEDVGGKTLNELRGELSAKTRTTTLLDNGKTIAEDAAIKAAHTMQNTKIGGKTLKDLRIEKAHSTKVKINKSGLNTYQEAGLKGSKTKSKVGEDGLTVAQRAATKNPCCISGTKESSDIGRKRNDAYNNKLAKMSEEEFTEWCKGRSKCVISGAISRRNKMLVGSE